MMGTHEQARHPRGSWRSAIAVLAAPLLSLAGEAFAQQTSTVEDWYRWDTTLMTTRDYHLNGGNPYRNIRIRVTFTPTLCSGSPWCQSFTGYGFWDGGRTFKVRSTFPKGTWSWSATCSGLSNGFDCSTDPALDSVLGGGQSTTSAFGTVTVTDNWVTGDNCGTGAFDMYNRGLPRVSPGGRAVPQGCARRWPHLRYSGISRRLG
jgi:hypothetical protein